MLGGDSLDALNRIIPFVNYVHLKDVRKTEDGLGYCAFGEGQIEWKPILQLLTSQYSGYCAIEYERKEDVEEGTRISLNNLRQLMNKIRKKVY